MILVIPAAFLVAISILVAVHEFGHYWVAKKLGFKVLRFSIGFGKPLLDARRQGCRSHRVLPGRDSLGRLRQAAGRARRRRGGIGTASLLHAPADLASHRRAAGGTRDESAVRILAVRDFGHGRYRDRQAGGRRRCGSTVPPPLAGLQRGRPDRARRRRMPSRTPKSCRSR